MYKIGLRSGAAVSAGHMMEVAGTLICTSINPGDVVCIVDGEMKYTPTEGCPDALVSAVEKDSSGNPIRGTVMLLTPDMFLEVLVMGTDDQISRLANGKYIQFDTDCVYASGTSEYCQIIDTLSAKTAGDTILVRFIRKEIE